MREREGNGQRGREGNGEREENREKARERGKRREAERARAPRELFHCPHLGKCVFIILLRGEMIRG